MKSNFPAAIIVVACACLPVQVLAQDSSAPASQKEDFKFETVRQLPVTSVKNQSGTGTCWCFAVTSFMESEALRKGFVGDLDLAEMYTVYNAYQDRAEKYIRVDGAMNFGEGSSFGDVLTIMDKYGAVPESEMRGLNYGSERHNHRELSAGLAGYVEGISHVKGNLTPVWKQGVKAILDCYLGPAPETFSVDGVEYTPHTYFESLGIDPSDYVELTSWTHLSMYEKHPIESADNWRWETAYNIPLDEFMAVMDNSIEKGYTFAWGSDVSEIGFTRDGIGIVPDMKALAETSGSDQARWTGAPDGRSGMPRITGPMKELEVTPEMRQEEYEDKNTTEDHAMHAFGIARDQNGTEYFMIKNSWGETGRYKGIWYVSKTFVRYKTLAIMVHKDAIPEAIRAKLGI